MSTIPELVSAALRRQNTYTGADLGLRFSRAASAFRVWAPLADEVQVVFYREGLRGSPVGLWPMKPGGQGTWVRRVAGNWEGLYYAFRVRHGETVAEAIDPYAKAVGANGMRGHIVDLAKTNPPGWSRDRAPSQGAPTDAILYELHVRDFTIHPAVGAKHPGLFLGVVEKGLRAGGVAAGLDHLKELGVTHVHLLPAFDYASIDETKPEKKQYNWGYDPQNYNTPEGSYSTNAADGAVRIREFKQMVQGLHRAGIRVVMDVVYNHTYRTTDAHFNVFAPGYYYRQNAEGGYSNGSGCGNEVASERPMVRKMMIDSLVYWAKEFHVDGFRFDLMGLHDLETMKQIRAALDRVDRSILLYGEGWTGGDSPLPFAKRAMKTNMLRLDRVAAFSDGIRDGIKGSVMDHHSGGFVQGAQDCEGAIRMGIVASTKHPQVASPKGDAWRGPWAVEPWRCVTYNSCHDNHALWDKIAIAAKDEPEAMRIRMNKLAGAIVLTSQGIAFLHAGEEFLRTKKGVENSYNKPDSINAIDWRRKARYRAVSAYYAGLIALRKALPEFRMKTADEIRRRLKFLPASGPGLVVYEIRGAKNHLLIALNSRRTPVHIDLASGAWQVLVDDEKASPRPIRRVNTRSMAIPPVSALILRRA